MAIDVAVVGAGAAGLAAAIHAGQGGARVLLLNAHPKVGLKILMSGGTRCNVTHRDVTERDYSGGSRAVVARTLRAFGAEQTRAWFASMDVPLRLEDTGKYFPTTDDARTVLDALLARARALGVVVESGWRVVRLDEGFVLSLQAMANSQAFGPVAPKYGQADWELPAVHAERTVAARRVVLATGGISFPRTGSDGTGYALARSLGHTIVAPIPCLTPLTSADALSHSLQGVTLDLELTLWVDGTRVARTRGSCVFTHVGMSGPAALDISRHWLRAGDARARAITARFVPDATEESLSAAWIAAARHSQRTVRRHLGNSLPDRVVLGLCEECAVPPAAPLGQVRKDARTALVRALLGRDMRVTGTLGFEKAEATAGGVDLSEVDPSTLESRKAPGVFLCGEILDVDGRLGGFNFQWAWSSGAVAGAAAARGV
jgi:hypothetical protein